MLEYIKINIQTLTATVSFYAGHIWRRATPLRKRLEEAYLDGVRRIDEVAYDYSEEVSDEEVSEDSHEEVSEDEVSEGEVPTTHLSLSKFTAPPPSPADIRSRLASTIAENGRFDFSDIAKRMS